MTETINLVMDEIDDCEIHFVRLENGVSLTIFQVKNNDYCSINIHGAKEDTDITVMGRKVSKKLDELGNTNLKVVN